MICSIAATHVAEYAIRICSTAATHVAKCRIAGPLFYSIPINSYRFTQTYVVAVESQYVTHHSFFVHINAILCYKCESHAFLHNTSVTAHQIV
jgi:hypothetical protein